MHKAMILVIFALHLSGHKGPWRCVMLVNGELVFEVLVSQMDDFSVNRPHRERLHKLLDPIALPPNYCTLSSACGSIIFTLYMLLSYVEVWSGIIPYSIRKWLLPLFGFTMVCLLQLAQWCHQYSGMVAAVRVLTCTLNAYVSISAEERNPLTFGSYKRDTHSVKGRLHHMFICKPSCK